MDGKGRLHKGAETRSSKYVGLNSNLITSHTLQKGQAEHHRQGPYWPLVYRYLIHGFHEATRSDPDIEYKLEFNLRDRGRKIKS